MASRVMFVGLLSALSLGGCAYDDGYGGGYGGVSVGTGYYAGDYYGPAGYYDPSYYGGWYNDYYYPGNGYYVFDRGGRRHRWDDGQRNYWEARRQQYRARDQARGPDGNNGRWRDGDAGRWRDGNRGRDYDRSVDRDAAGQPGRGFEGRGSEGRGGWRPDRPTDGMAAGAVVQPPARPDRPAYRERPNFEGNAGQAGAERRQVTPRSEGRPERNRGNRNRSQE